MYSLLSLFREHIFLSNLIIKTHIWSEFQGVPVKHLGLVVSSGNPEGHAGVEAGLVVVGTNQGCLFELDKRK